MDKRRDYAERGIVEYWIVDPRNTNITVLKFEDGKDVEHGVFGAGVQATSALLADLTVSVDAVFNAE